MTNYRLFPATNGPASPSAYSGNYLAGVGFEVTQGGMWFTGYWWWVCNSGQQTTAQKFALWEITSGTVNGALISGSVVTSGTLTAGAWNYVPLAAPLPLSINTWYQAATGYVSTTGFPETDNQFGTSQPLAAGITNGPLFAYGNAAQPANTPAQSQFSTAGADPSVNMPLSAFNNANFWMDLQVTDTPPGGSSYRLWPNQPVPLNWVPDTPQSNWTLATEFTLSQLCTVNNLWFYSPSGSTVLPGETGIWNVSSQTVVAGTHNTSPSWSGAAGSGWVSVAAGYTLAAGDYKVAVLNGGSIANAWSATTFPYWGDATHPVGPGVGGITAGPLSAPDNAHATTPGQSTYHQATTFSWPDTYASGVGSATYWVDIEVTPSAATATAAAAAVTVTARAPVPAVTGGPAAAAVLAAAPAPGVTGFSNITAPAAVAAVRAAGVAVPPGVSEGTLTAADTAAAVLTATIWPP